MTTDSTTIDIVIPTFNHATYLRDALQSVVQQTHERWRAVVVNNYSTDDTADVIASFADSRITRIDFRNNGVIGAARNVGIRTGSAPYVAFLDSDDVWYPNKLHYVLQQLENGADLVCHPERWVEVDGTSRIVRYGRGKPVTFSTLLYSGNALSTSAVTMRRTLLESLGGFSTDKDVVTAEDYDLWIRVAKSGARLVFAEETLGEFRRRHGSESSKIERNIAAERVVILRHFPVARTLRERARQRRRLALVEYGAARAHQTAGDRRRAMRGLLRTIMQFPIMIRPPVALGLLVVDSILKRGLKRSDKLND